MNIEEYCFAVSADVVFDGGLQLSGLSVLNENLSVHYLVYRMDNLVNGKHYIGQHITKNPFDGYAGSGNLIRKAVAKYGIESFRKTLLFDFDNIKDMDRKEAELVPLSCCYPYDKMSYNLRGGGLQGRMTERAKKALRKRILMWWETKDKFFRKAWGEETSRRNTGENNGMYGKCVKDFMSKDAYAEMCRKKSEKSRIRAKDPKWLAKMSEVTRGENNGMYGKKLRDYMTDETFQRMCDNHSKAVSGDKNPMYGKNVKDYMSKTAYAEMLNNRSKAMKGRKDMTNGICCRKVKPEDFDKYLSEGYWFKDKRFNYRRFPKT